MSILRMFASLLVFVTLCHAGSCLAAQKTETFSVTSPINVLSGSELGAAPDDNVEPYKSGELDPEAARNLLRALNIPPKSPTDEPTIFHIVRWGDAKHTTVKFQRWYLLNPPSPGGGFYLLSEKKRFEDTYLPGVRQFRFIFIHLNFDLKVPGESVQTAAGATTPTLVVPVSYTIAITQQDTQFIQDVKALLQIVGVTGAAAAAATLQPGYWGYSEITSQFSTSTVTITPSLSKPSPVVGSTDSTKAASTLSPNTYTNEAPTYYGLSIAVPVNSYTDVSYNSSSGTLVPKSATKQNAYAAFDVYYPPAIPALMTFRYIPHPFVALPLAGKVFESPMLGLAVGSPWLEAYAGAVFDRENGSINGSAQKTTTKWSFGIKISVSALASAIKGASSTKSSSTK
jgi:hypothetical protein